MNHHSIKSDRLDYRGAQFHQVQGALKKTISRASVKSLTKHKNKEISSSSLKRIGGAFLSGMVYLVTLMIICVIVLIYLY